MAKRDVEIKSLLIAFYTLVKDQIIKERGKVNANSGQEEEVTFDLDVPSTECVYLKNCHVNTVISKSHVTFPSISLCSLVFT